MELVVFGDDWGAHPSTTQHLIRALPEARVLWVNSLGMRSPSLSRADLIRAYAKLRASSSAPRLKTRRAVSDPHVIEPRILPFHASPQARAINGVLLGHALRAAYRALGFSRPHVLAANPVAAYYLDAFEHGRVGYLRLDDYPQLPGVDTALARDAEALMNSRADVGFGTAHTLLPDQGTAIPWHTVPQGVDVAHFAGVASSPPRSRILGFFGLLAEWVDYDLIRSVARANPDWTLELLGTVRHLPEDVKRLSNVRVLAPVAYAALPAAIGKWDAAWLPFVRNQLTRGVNPLKLREYLAAGLPTFSTPLPAADDIPHITFGKTASEVTAWLSQQVCADSETLRLARRQAMRSHSWSARASQLGDALLGTAAAAPQMSRNDARRPRRAAL